MSGVAAAVALAVALSAAPAAATTILGASLDQLARTADEIVVGRVVSIQPVVDAGRVWTRVTIAPEQCYVGEPRPVIEIVVPGGRTDTLATWVPGADEYETGERVLVFLELRPDGRFVSPALSFSKFSLLESPQGVVAVRRPEGLRVEPVTDVIVPDIERNVFELVEIESVIAAARGVQR